MRRYNGERASGHSQPSKTQQQPAFSKVSYFKAKANHRLLLGFSKNVAKDHARIILTRHPQMICFTGNKQGTLRYAVLFFDFGKSLYV